MFAQLISSSDPQCTTTNRHSNSPHAFARWFQHLQCDVLASRAKRTLCKPALGLPDPIEPYLRLWHCEYHLFIFTQGRPYAHLPCAPLKVLPPHCCHRPGSLLLFGFLTHCE